MPMAGIEKVAVLGAGVMGAGIAAHVANAGVPVVLLDIVPAGRRGPRRARQGCDRAMLKAEARRRSCTPRRAKLVTPGNLEDDLGLLAECDWIVEAVVERLDVKQHLYRALDAVRKPGSIVSSNTSTIPLAQARRGAAGELRQRLPRHPLLQPAALHAAARARRRAATRPEAAAAATRLLRRAPRQERGRLQGHAGLHRQPHRHLLDRGATRGGDRGGLTVEEADAVAGRPIGFPKTGVFGLLDLVGIDLGPHIAKPRCSRPCRPTTPTGRSTEEPPAARKMIAAGYTGRKGKGGFYRLALERRREAQAGDRPRDRRVSRRDQAAPRERRGGAPGRATRAARARGRRRPLRLAHAVAARSPTPPPWCRRSPTRFPRRRGDAHRLQLEVGPVRAPRPLGPAWLAARLAAEGRAVPPLLAAVGDGTFYRVEGGKLQHLSTDGSYRDLERPRACCCSPTSSGRLEPVAKNGSASLWDLGDGVLCLEFTPR
jgi:3-hydroxyacyl-CoA dehydrogenase